MFLKTQFGFPEYPTLTLQLFSRERSKVLSCGVKDPGSPGFTQQVTIPQGSSSAASRGVGGDKVVGFPPIFIPADYSGAALDSSFQGLGMLVSRSAGLPWSCGL